MSTERADATSGATRVDVGIALWGHSPYLEHAVDSIARQTLPSWRLHLAQDGPPEPSVEALVARRGDPRIAYSSGDRSRGAPATKTRLVRAATAPYVALLDHDDAWGPEFLRRRVEFLDAHPDCGLVFSPSVTIDGSGAVSARERRRLADGVYSPDQIVPLLVRWSGIPGSTVVARRAAYREVGDAFRDALPRTYDYEMWLRLALRFPVGYLTARDAYWRRHGANTSLAQVHGYDEEYERLVSHLERSMARTRPDLLPDPTFWRRKVSGLLLMTALDALEAGDRQAARQFLLRAVRRDVRRGLDARAVAVAVGATSRPASAVVALVRRTRRRRRGR